MPCFFRIICLNLLTKEKQNGIIVTEILVKRGDSYEYVDLCEH